MIVARIKRINFTLNDNEQTVAFQKFGKRLNNSTDFIIDAVIANSKEEAIKMLRKNLKDYINKSSFSYEYEYIKWFGFTISTAKVENNRFSMDVWFEEGTEYSACGEIL